MSAIKLAGATTLYDDFVFGRYSQIFSGTQWCWVFVEGTNKTCAFADYVQGSNSLIGNTGGAGGGIYGTWDHGKAIGGLPSGGGSVLPPYSSFTWFGLVNGAPRFELFDARNPALIAGAFGTLTDLTIVGAALTPNVCHHVAVVADWANVNGAVGTYRLYVDGVLQDTQSTNPNTVHGVGDFYHDAPSLTIGSSRDGYHGANSSGVHLSRLGGSTVKYTAPQLLADYNSPCTELLSPNKSWYIFNGASDLLEQNFAAPLTVVSGSVTTVADCCTPAPPPDPETAPGKVTTPVSDDACCAVDNPGSLGGGDNGGSPGSGGGTPVKSGPGGANGNTPAAPAGAQNGTGASGTNPGGVGSVSPCSGGGEAAYYPSPTPYETFAGQRTLRLWADLQLQDFNANTAIPVEMAYGAPIPDPPTYEHGYKPRMIQAISPITRSMSNQQGDVVGTSVTLTINDKARTIRKYRAGAGTRYFNGRECNIKISSETLRRLRTGGGTYLFRGIVRGADLSRQLVASIMLQDYLSSEYGPLGARRVISDRVLTRGLFPGIPPANIGQSQSLVLGYVGDNGSKDPTTGLAAEKGLVPVTTVGTRTIAGLGQYIEFFVAGHACVNIDVYASNPDKTARVKVTDADYGSNVLAPGHTGWPFANKYFDYVDADTGKTHRCATFFIKVGTPMADAALLGEINTAANVCGMDEFGTGEGRVVTGLFPQLHMLFDNFILPRPGYYTGSFNAAPKWGSDNAWMINSDTFLAMQALTQTFIGGEGYIGSYLIKAGALSKDVVRDYMITAHANYFWTPDGRVSVDVPNTTMDVSATPRVVEPFLLRQGLAPQFSSGAIENPIRFNYDYDYDKNKWRGEQVEIRDDEAIRRTGGERAATVGCPATNDYATALDAMSRRLIWRKYERPVYVVALPIDGIDAQYELGQVVRGTSYDGLGNGEVDTPVRLEVQTYDPSNNRVTFLATGLADPTSGTYDPSTGLGAPPTVTTAAAFDTATFDGAIFG